MEKQVTLNAENEGPEYFQAAVAMSMAPQAGAHLLLCTSFLRSLASWAQVLVLGLELL